MIGRNTGSHRCRTAVGVWQRTLATEGTASPQYSSSHNLASRRARGSVPGRHTGGQGPLLHVVESGISTSVEGVTCGRRNRISTRWRTSHGDRNAGRNQNSTTNTNRTNFNKAEIKTHGTERVGTDERKLQLQR